MMVLNKLAAWGIEDTNVAFPLRNSVVLEKQDLKKKSHLIDNDQAVEY